MREYKPFMIWILIVGGLLWGYEGVTGTNLLMSVLGSTASIVEVIVGVVALLVAYLKLTAKK